MKKDKKGHDPASEQAKKNSPTTHHGHATGAEGANASNVEPTLRSATTDSSRLPKNKNDDLPEGGNIR